MPIAQQSSLPIADPAFPERYDIGGEAYDDDDDDDDDDGAIQYGDVDDHGTTVPYDDAADPDQTLPYADVGQDETLQYSDDNGETTRDQKREGKDSSTSRERNATGRSTDNFCYRSFPVWHSEHSVAYQNDWVGYPELNEDYLAHVLRDVEYILNCSSREDEGFLAWDARQAEFTIPFGARESFCFWYDLIEDRCYSVSSDELPTPDVAENCQAVEEADRKEVMSFATNDSFKLAQRDSRAYNRVDGWHLGAEMIVSKSTDS